MEYTIEMKQLLALHGYPSTPIPIDDRTIFCNKEHVHVGMDESEYDYGGQTEVCTLCGKAWSCEYAGANRQINNVICPKIKPKKMLSNFQVAILPARTIEKYSVGYKKSCIDFIGVIKAIADNIPNHPKGTLLLATSPVRRYISHMWEAQYVYILDTNDSIKENDWIYCQNANDITNNFSMGSLYKDRCYRIVATNDPALELPGITDEFLQAFVYAQGKGNIYAEHTCPIRDCKCVETINSCPWVAPKIDNDGNMLLYISDPSGKVLNEIPLGKPETCILGSTPPTPTDGYYQQGKDGSYNILPQYIFDEANAYLNKHSEFELKTFLHSIIAGAYLQGHRSGWLKAKNNT